VINSATSSVRPEVNAPGAARAALASGAKAKPIGVRARTPKARAAAADPARQPDPDQGGAVDGRGRGEGQAQPLVDRRADGAGLGADAGRREQDVVGAVLGAVGVAQRLGAGGQFAVQEPVQRGLGASQPVDQGQDGSPRGVTVRTVGSGTDMASPAWRAHPPGRCGVLCATMVVAQSADRWCHSGTRCEDARRVGFRGAGGGLDGGYD
jgi:hypothetical protein